MTLGGREISHVRYDRNQEEDAIVRHKLACAAIRREPEETQAAALRQALEVLGVPLE
jgi:hypothetical protein